MLLLARALLVPAALSLWSAAGVAKEIKGAPKEFIGYFGKDADQCRSYYRKGGEELLIIKEDYFSECSAKQCSAELLSHHRTSDEVVLNIKITLLDGSIEETRSIARVGRDKIKVGGGEFDGEILTRCTLKDIVAGIGLPAFDQANDVDFAYHYARAVLRLCPRLKAGPELESKEFGPYRTLRGVNDLAESYVKRDKRRIKGFCNEVLGAFGPNGRVAANMLRAAK
jgi:hypothetical protein